MFTVPEKVMQSVRERADAHLAERGREVLVLDIDPDEFRAVSFHWAARRHNHESGTDEHVEATLMLKTLQAMKAVAEAQANLDQLLGRL